MKTFNFTYPVYSFDYANENIDICDEYGESFDLFDLFDENSYLSVNGKEYPFVQYDNKTIYLDSDYFYKEEMFKEILSGYCNICIVAYQTDIFIHLCDSVKGYSQIIYFDIPFFSNYEIGY